MAADRVSRILEQLDLGTRPRDTLHGLCVECAREFDVTGVGVALILGGEHCGNAGTSDRTAALVGQLQSTWGEGPCVDAHRSGRQVAVPDLARSARWPAFAPAAIGAGVRAVFAFPLRTGAARFGALHLYRHSAGDLLEQDAADASAVAELVTTLVVMLLAGAPHAPLGEWPAVLVDNKAIVHQAAGMVAAQLGVSLEDAIVALRARAFAADCGVRHIAAEVVASRVRFEP